MFHYKSLFIDEVGAIRQRGPEPLQKKKLRRTKSVCLCITKWCSILPVTSRKQELFGHSVLVACLAVTVNSELTKLKVHLFVSTRCSILGVV